MREEPAGGAFVEALRYALLNLYDPARLRTSPLLTLFDLGKRHDPTTALRQILAEGVQALRPRADVPLQSNAWRFYHVLTYRYIEQTNARLVASNLSLSERQFRRAERDAEEQLADYLWARYSLDDKADILLTSLSPPAEKPASMQAEMPGREQELEWMRASFPSETAQIAELIDPVLKIAMPLLQSSNVQVRCELPPNLAPVTGQLSAIRQALLNLLITAARIVPDGQVLLSAQAARESVNIQIEASYGPDIVPPHPAIEENLEMAHQFTDLFGGTLKIIRGAERPLVATLTLPRIEQISILVVDDNADTLRLLQRYLDGSRYYCIGLRDPEAVLDTVQQYRPQIIVLDVMLPGIEDWELLRRLQEYPAAQGVPILICTILPQEELALALGAADFIRKPVNRQDFLSALDRQVRQLSSGSR